MCYIIGLSNGAVTVITLVVSVPITAVITIVIIYYCCIKSKGGYFLSATGPPALYETPVSTSGVSSLEMKDTT